MRTLVIALAALLTGSGLTLALPLLLKDPTRITAEEQVIRLRQDLRWMRHQAGRLAKRVETATKLVHERKTTFEKDRDSEDKFLFRLSGALSEQPPD